MQKVFVAIICITCSISCGTGIKQPAGGYAYVKDYHPIDTEDYFRPLRPVLSREDSFRFANYRFDYQKFGEGNISLQPGKQNIYRLYCDGFRESYVLILNGHRLTIKHKLPVRQLYQPRADEELTRKEAFWFRIMNRHFPGLTPDIASGRAFYNYDSLLSLYPMLASTTFYEKLYLKANLAFLKDSYPLEVKSLDLTESQYRRFVDSLNISGFWRMPIRLKTVDRTDGGGFAFEAGTAGSYNLVIATLCDPDSSTRFKLACQQLVHIAGLDSFIDLPCLPRPKDTSSQTPKKPMIVQDVQLEDVSAPSDKAWREMVRRREREKAAEARRLRVEDHIFDTIYFLPEVRKKAAFIDSVSRHKKDISVFFKSKPSDEETAYLVAVGYSGTDRFEPYYIFSVSPSDLGIRVQVKSSDSLIPLDKWRSFSLETRQRLNP